jgi:hypothetical protein
MHSNIAFACGFLIVIGLCLIPYDSHRNSKISLNSLPLSYIKYQHCGYPLNQILLTNCAMQLELLLKMSSAIDDSLPLTAMAFSWQAEGSSTISNQLDVGLIIVRAMKSMIVPSLPLRVYGPVRTTHNALHGIVVMSLGGRCPSLSLHFLLTWHDLHDFLLTRLRYKYFSSTL